MIGCKDILKCFDGTILVFMKKNVDPRKEAPGA